MKFSSAVSALALASGALAGEYEYSNGTSTAVPVVYETITTTALTTYCPYATTVVHGSKTYTVSEATTLTITDCPCTVTKPVVKPTPSTVLYTSCPPSDSAAKPTATHPAGAHPKSSGPAYSNPLTTYPAGHPQPTGSAQATSPYAFTGAAAANQVGGLMAGAVAAALVALAW